MAKSRWIGGLCCLAALYRVVDGQPSPIVVEPSEYWEGNDGSWSTFFVRLGSQDKVVRLLVSTAFPNTVTIINSTCPQGDDSSCASDRGEVFAPNSSTTWQYKGSFGLYSQLNFTKFEEPAYFGLDSVGLGNAASGTKLEDQVVAALGTDDYYLGLLGINPQTTNWTQDFKEQSPSFFKTLSTQNLIPSYTYSYTAGAQYRLKGVFGSLIFGGYDASRAKPPKDDVIFTMADDVSRDLVVAIQGITTNMREGATLLSSSQSVLALIDSTFPYFILPFDICEAFERQFGLVWNPDAGPNGMYTLSDSQHTALQAINPNVTFTLGNTLTSGLTTKITLPYAAFDLQASPPLVNSTTAYFPLLRAANDSQVTLGRAFLQEAMLVVDYTHHDFSVWPCVWDENASSDVVTLTSLDTLPGGEGSLAATPQQDTSRLHLALGLGIGLGLGLLTLSAFPVYLFIKRRRQHQAPQRADSHQKFTPSNKTQYLTSELASTEKSSVREKDGSAFAGSREAVGSEVAREMEDSSPRQELPGTPVSAVVRVHMRHKWSMVSSSSSLSPSLVSPSSRPTEGS